MKKIVATIEARMTSSRLPGKVLLDLSGKPALEQMIQRIRKSRKVDEIVVATTINSTDLPIIQLCEKIGCRYFRGDENDVLKRVLDAASSVEATHIVELTGDCPLIDPAHIDQMIDYYFEQKCQYAYNRLIKGLPEGFDVQVFSVSDLAQVEKMTKDPIDRVHVSCYFYNNPDKFKIACPEPSKNDNEYWPDLSLTLDEKADYLLLKKIFAEAATDGEFLSLKKVISYLRKNPDLAYSNKHIVRKQLSDG